MIQEASAVSLFESKLGWFALAGRAGRVTWCSFGHRSRTAAWQLARRALGADAGVRDWNPSLRKRLLEYSAGRRGSFEDVDLDLDRVPQFHRAVLQACREIPYGATQTYRELAAAAGRATAVRAAGTAMARNPFPILVPCHRVLRSDGKLGGYSAPTGVSLKERLLRMESLRPGSTRLNS